MESNQNMNTRRGSVAALHWLVSWRAASVAYILIWTVRTATYVHRKMDVHSNGEEYGWAPCIMLTLMLVLMASLSYNAGKSDRDAS